MMAERRVKTMKRDYISLMPKPGGFTAVKNLADAFGHYNEWHPHSVLGYRSPREHLRRQTSNGLSNVRVDHLLDRACRIPLDAPGSPAHRAPADAVAAPGTSAV